MAQPGHRPALAGGLAGAHRRIHPITQPATNQKGSGPVELLGVLPDRYTLEVGLRGWWQICEQPGGLT